jgi:hypothetical protein
VSGPIARAIAALTTWLNCHPDAGVDDLAKSLIAVMREHGVDIPPVDRIFAVAAVVPFWSHFLALLDDLLLLSLVEASVRAFAGGTPVVPADAAAAVSRVLSWLRVARLLDSLRTGASRPPARR